MRDTFTKKEFSKYSSYMGMLVSLVPALAPLVGGIIQQIYDYRANFVIMLLYGVLNLLLIVYKLPETQQEVYSYKFLELVKNYKAVILNYSFIINAICSGCAFGAVIIY